MMHDLWLSDSLIRMREFARAQWNARIQKLGMPPLPANYRFEIYRDPVMALNEIVRGLLEYFPHKRTIAYVRGTSPKLAEFLPGLAREGIHLKEIPLEIAEQTADQAFSLVNSDTLLIIMGMTDPLTGRHFNLQELEKKAFEKKVFCVELIPTFEFSFVNGPASPYRAQICSVGPQLAFACLGSRAKGPALVFGACYFNGADEELLKTSFDQADAQQIQNESRKNLILSFERLKPGTSETLFPIESERSWDRACLLWRDLDGSAICELLCERLALTLESQLGQHLDTASACRWTGWGSMSWLKEQGLSESRGIVIFHILLLEKYPELASLLTGVCEELRQLQNG